MDIIDTGRAGLIFTLGGNRTCSIAVVLPASFFYAIGNLANVLEVGHLR